MTQSTIYDRTNYLDYLAAATQWMILTGLPAERAAEKHGLSEKDIPKLNQLREWTDDAPKFYD